MTPRGDSVAHPTSLSSGKAGKADLLTNGRQNGSIGAASNWEKWKIPGGVQGAHCLRRREFVHLPAFG